MLINLIFKDGFVKYIALPNNLRSTSSATNYELSRVPGPSSQLPQEHQASNEREYHPRTHQCSWPNRPDKKPLPGEALFSLGQSQPGNASYIKSSRYKQLNKIILSRIQPPNSELLLCGESKTIICTWTSEHVTKNGSLSCVLNLTYCIFYYREIQSSTLYPLYPMYQYLLLFLPGTLLMNQRKRACLHYLLYLTLSFEELLPWRESTTIICT